MTFELNKIFNGMYPPEAAMYCDINGYVLVELENGEDSRRFQIQQIPPPAEPSPEELFESLRSERDSRITDLLWMRERHADELALGKETTLTPEQYTALLTYVQALRDLPAQPGAPWPAGDIPWPVLPVEL